MTTLAYERSSNDYGLEGGRREGMMSSVGSGLGIRGPALNIDTSRVATSSSSSSQARERSQRGGNGGGVGAGRLANGVGSNGRQGRDYETAQYEEDPMMDEDEEEEEEEEYDEEDLSGDEVAHRLHTPVHHTQSSSTEYDDSREMDNEDSLEREEHGDERGVTGEGDDSGSFSDSMSSSPSIPDEDIDFSLVYALHTFLATVDGQASVVKGDKLLLLDDSNSYWWLVRVLKTQAVGYIPAENIETPFERLARLNKHRNVDLTTATDHDLITGPSSTAAQTRFDGRIPPSAQPHPHESQHPSAKGILASPSHKDHPRNMSPLSQRPERSASSKAKSVGFTAPTFYEHSANGLSDDGEDEYGEDDELYEDENGELRGQQIFDEDDGEESEFSDDGLTQEDEMDPESRGGDLVSQGTMMGARQPFIQHDRSVMHQDEGEDGGDEDDLTESEWEARQTRSTQLGQGLQPLENVAAVGWHPQQEDPQSQVDPQELHHRALSPMQKQSLELQRQMYQQAAGTALVATPIAAAAAAALHISEPRSRSSSANSHHSPSNSLDRQAQEDSAYTKYSSDTTRNAITTSAFDPNAPTKKLTATPPIIRDPTFDMNNPLGDVTPTYSSPSQPPRMVRGVEVIDPKDPRYARLVVSEKRKLQDEQENLRPLQDASYPTGEGEMSMNSIETGSSFISGISGVSSENLSGSINSLASNKKSKKLGKESAEESDKKKKGGILSGLFRKKDKKKKDDMDGRPSEDSLRTASSPVGKNSSESSSSTWSPVNNTGASMFSTDAALRQQQVEAKQAMHHQYGIQRAPGDLTNTMTPRPQPLNPANLSPNTKAVAGGTPRMRPGSLIGSPSIPGLDVPVLSVMRVFAGERIDAEATFKTVLLNSSTTTADLVKQCMQRFRLTGSEDKGEFYLTVKELGGEERPLYDDQKPLVIFEALSDSAGGSNFVVPSVKRSSIGSINSISSNLSINPAITRLGMNDWSDDSAVKFYLNRRAVAAKTATVSPAMAPNTSPGETSSFSPKQLGGQVGNQNSPILASGLTPEQAASSASPSLRFALRVIIRPGDLPENVVFDPHSNAIIPKSVLVERLQRQQGSIETPPVLPDAREKIIFFPRNVNVSDVVEAGLDRFGIVDGVVSGGDEVEDRVSRRRSVSRVKYTLAVVKNGGEETILPASAKVLDSYQIQPQFRAYDRSSREFRRRSVDATLILGTSSDLLPSDPVFIICRAPHRSSVTGSSRSTGPIPLAVDELEQRQLQKSNEAHATNHGQQYPIMMRSLTGASGTSVYTTPSEEPSEDVLARALGNSHPTPKPFASTSESSANPTTAAQKRQELIAAQRAASRANQRAILSAQQNSDMGVDIHVPDHGTIRSVRTGDHKESVRYSFIDSNGTVTDISQIVQRELTAPLNPESMIPNSTTEGEEPDRSSSMSRSSNTSTATGFAGGKGRGMSPDNGSFQSAHETLGGAGRRPSEGSQTRRLSSEVETGGGDMQEDGNGDAKDRRAISELQATRISVDQSVPHQRTFERGTNWEERGSGTEEDDLLKAALGQRAVTSPVLDDHLQDRLDRVLAKVRDDKARGFVSPRLRQISETFSSENMTPNGRLSPSVMGTSTATGRSVSPYGVVGAGVGAGTIGAGVRSLSSQSGRLSPFVSGANNSHLADQSSKGVNYRQHGKEASVTSTSSSALSSIGTNGTDNSHGITSGGSGAGGRGIGGAGNTSGGPLYTPLSSVESPHSRRPSLVAYRDDFGFDNLVALVDAASATPFAPTRSNRADGEQALGTPEEMNYSARNQGVEHLFGRHLNDIDRLDPQTRSLFAQPQKKLDDLDSRLDSLLFQAMRV